MLSTYLTFWIAVPVAWFVARIVFKTKKGLTPFSAVALGWSLYGIFVAALRQMATPTDSDIGLMLGMVLPALLTAAATLGPIGSWMLDRAMARREFRWRKRNRPSSVAASGESPAAQTMGIEAEKVGNPDDRPTSAKASPAAGNASSFEAEHGSVASGTTASPIRTEILRADARKQPNSGP